VNLPYRRARQNGAAMIILGIALAVYAKTTNCNKALWLLDLKRELKALS
jgi:hypothetical protein